MAPLTAKVERTQCKQMERAWFINGWGSKDSDWGEQKGMASLMAMPQDLFSQSSVFRPHLPCAAVCLRYSSIDFAAFVAAGTCGNVESRAAALYSLRASCHCSFF